MNPDAGFRALRYWMTTQERRDFAARRSAGFLSTFAALGGTLWVALRWESDAAFLLVHGALAMAALGAVAGWGAPRLVEAAGTTWLPWALRVTAGAALFLLAGLLGIGLGGGILSALGHPRPWGPLGALDPANLVLAVGSSFALSLAGCGAWAVAWRWMLRPEARR